MMANELLCPVFHSRVVKKLPRVSSSGSEPIIITRGLSEIHWISFLGRLLHPVNWHAKAAVDIGCLEETPEAVAQNEAGRERAEYGRLELISTQMMQCQMIC